VLSTTLLMHLSWRGLQLIQIYTFSGTGIYSSPVFFNGFLYIRPAGEELMAYQWQVLSCILWH
jgi:hypothetical protein